MKSPDPSTERPSKIQKAGDPERAATVTSLIAGTFEAQEAWEDALMEYKESSRTFKKLEIKTRSSAGEGLGYEGQ